MFNKSDMEMVKNWCRETGKYQMENFEREISVSSKSEKIDLVSEVDKKSENMLVEKINKAFPGHAILAEEGSGKDESSPFLWVVDPLDGTVNYVNGLPIFSISMAFFEGDRAEAAVVYLPVSDTFYTARRGESSYRDGNKLAVSGENDLSASIVGTGFPYDHQDENRDVLEYFSRVLPRVGGIRRLGSAVYDLCLVAEGTLEAFWEVRLNPWDVAAGALIVREAGGKVTDFSGDKVSLSGQEVLAGSEALHGELLKLLSRDLAE